MLKTTWLCAALALAGCDACSSKHQVPFKLEPASPAAPAQPQPADHPPAAASGGPTGAALTYPEGTRSIVLGDATVSRADGSFRAALPIDLDGDGALDALLVATDAQGRPSLGSALRRGGQVVLQPTLLPLFGEQTRCSVEGANLTLLGPGLALVELGASCTESTAPAGAEATPTPSRVERLIVSVEVAPRILLSVGTRSPADQSPLSLTLASADLDADEHADVRLDVTLRDDGQDPQRISLSFMNRPSGLARETAEPEQTLSQLATTAGQFLPKNPADALAASKRVLTLHRLLCRESGQAELVVDGEPGIACGPSVAAGRGAVTMVIALARARDLLATADALAALDAPAYKIDAAPRERARKALALIPGDTAFVWRQGPEQRTPEGPAVRLPALAFIEEGQLLLRGAVARSYQLATGEIATVAQSPSVVMTDATGELAAVAVTRECEGARLHVVAAAQVIGSLAVDSGAGPKDTWLERTPTADPRCKGPQAQRGESLHVLGYTASGVLVARGAALWLVPAAGQGDARMLAGTEAAPALISPGALSADGLRHVLATSEGVAIVQRGATPKVSLVRTPASCTSAPTDAVLSPSGERLAMVCDGHVYFAERAGAAPLLPASPVPTPTPEPTPDTAPVPGAMPIEQLPPPIPEHNLDTQ